MLKDYSSQPASNSRTIVVFTSILDVCNKRSDISKLHLGATKYMFRRQFIENLVVHATYKETFVVTFSPKACVRCNKFCGCIFGQQNDNMANDEVSVDSSQNISVKPAKFHLMHT